MNAKIAAAAGRRRWDKRAEESISVVGGGRAAGGQESWHRLSVRVRTTASSRRQAVACCPSSAAVAGRLVFFFFLVCVSLTPLEIDRLAGASVDTTVDPMHLPNSVSRCFDSTLKPPDAAAQGNPIAYREHADLDPGINGQGFVKLQHEIPVILDVLPHRSIGWGHHGTVPQSVVVADHAPNLNQINQPLVVVEVVVLVSIHEYEVVCAMVLWL
nr:hypothetical protein Iba_chr14aCG13250 [Ipomoea batatas]